MLSRLDFLNARFNSAFQFLNERPTSSLSRTRCPAQFRVSTAKCRVHLCISSSKCEAHPRVLNYKALEVLNLTEDDVVDKFVASVSMVASLSLDLSYPTQAAAPHMFINAYKNALAVVVDTEYTFPPTERVKEYLNNLSKFATALAAKEEKKDEPSDESDDGDLDFNLFD